MTSNWLSSITSNGSGLLNDRLPNTGSTLGSGSSGPTRGSTKTKAPSDIGDFFRDLLSINNDQKQRHSQRSNGTCERESSNKNHTIEQQEQDQYAYYNGEFTIDPGISSLIPVDPSKSIGETIISGTDVSDATIVETTPISNVDDFDLHELLSDNDQLYKEGMALKERLVEYEHAFQTKNNTVHNLEQELEALKVELKDMKKERDLKMQSNLIDPEKHHSEVYQLKREYEKKMNVLQDTLSSIYKNSYQMEEVTELKNCINNQKIMIVDLEVEIEKLKSAMNDAEIQKEEMNLIHALPTLPKFDQISDPVLPSPSKDDRLLSPTGSVVKSCINCDILQEDVKKLIVAKDSLSESSKFYESELNKTIDGYRKLEEDYDMRINGLEKQLSEALASRSRPGRSLEDVTIETETDIETEQKNNNTLHITDEDDMTNSNISKQHGGSSPRSRILLSHRKNYMMKKRRKSFERSADEIIDERNKLVRELAEERSMHKMKMVVWEEKFQSQTRMVNYLHELLTNTKKS